MTGTTERVAATPAPPPGTRPRRRPAPARGAVVFPVVVVAVIIATVGLCLALTRDDGAATPEQALDGLVDAIEAGDGAGVLDALPPAERRAVTDALPDLTVALRALGLIESSDDQAPDLPTLQVDGLRVATTPFGENVAAVDLIGGTVTVSFGPGGGPLTESGQQVLAGPDGAAPDGPTVVTRDLAQEPIRLIAIREGGGWHISLAYSVVDALAADQGAAVPEMGTGPFPYGAATADAAVTDFFRAYADGFLERMVTVLASDEARSLYDYAPAVLPGTTALIDALRASGAYDVQLNSIRTHVEGTGDTRTVSVTDLDLDIRDQIQKVHLRLADRCLHVDYRIDDDDAPYATYDVCADEWDDPDAARRPLDNPVGNAAVFGGGAELPPFTVVERNGRWFISPIRTALDATTSTLAGLDPAGQRAFIDRLTRSARAGVGDGLVGDPLPIDLSPEDRAATLIGRCDALLPGEPSTAPAAVLDPTAPVTDPSVPGTTAPDAAGATATSETLAGATRRDCIDRLVRTGSISWDAIPEDRRAGLAPPPPPPA